MEMRAYSELYLSDAMEALAGMYDFAVNVCNMDICKFTELFLATPVASGFEKGNPKYIAGMSGIELVYTIYDQAGEPMAEIEYQPKMDRSPEYWFGWALAYYQWYTGKRFKRIFQKVSPEEILRMYPTLHEADIRKFAHVMDQKMEERKGETNLKWLRKNAGLSQAELAAKTGVSLRSIQMYEQRHKDINKAQTASIVKLARILGCQVEDLME